MGSRANLVFVDENGYQLFYCHGCALSLPKHIFWGAQHTISYILKQDPLPNHDWLDHVWAEGGVLVDIERHHLMIFGGEDLRFDIQLRRLYMELLNDTWQGWKVAWANDGIADFGTYLGLPGSQFVAEIQKETVRYEALPVAHVYYPEHDFTSWLTLIASFVFELDKTHLIGLAGFSMIDLLRNGPHLIELAKQTTNSETLRLEHDENFPLAGVHIDVLSKRVEFWSANDPGALEILRPIWLDWELVWLKDDFDSHLSKLNNRFLLPVFDYEEMLTQLHSILFNDLNQEVDPLVYVQIFDDAVMRWRAKRAASL